MVPILKEMNPYPPTTFRLKIHFNIILQIEPRSSEWSLSFGLPNKNFDAFLLISPMRATWSFILTFLVWSY
jgi:hypothetical protein